MPKQFYVKYRELGRRAVNTAGAFPSEQDAEDFCSKLRAGSGGLFGLYHEVYVTDRATAKKERAEK